MTPGIVQTIRCRGARYKLCHKALLFVCGSVQSRRPMGGQATVGALPGRQFRSGQALARA